MYLQTIFLWCFKILTGSGCCWNEVVLYWMSPGGFWCPPTHWSGWIWYAQQNPIELQTLYERISVKLKSHQFQCCHLKRNRLVQSGTKINQGQFQKDEKAMLSAFDSTRYRIRFYRVAFDLLLACFCVFLKFCNTHLVQCLFCVF